MLQKRFQIVRLIVNAGDQAKAGKKEEDRRKNDAEIVENRNRTSIDRSITGGMLRQMMQDHADAGGSAEHFSLDKKIAAFPSGSPEDQYEKQDRINR